MTRSSKSLNLSFSFSMIFLSPVPMHLCPQTLRKHTETIFLLPGAIEDHISYSSPMEILHPLHFILLMSSLVLMVPNSAADPLSDALLSLKSEIVDESNCLNDWFLLPGNQPLGKLRACSWTGVKCSENSSKIISLDLSMKNLGGSLSGKQFPLFVDLIHLNLSHNSLSNQLPASIFNLTSLTTLDISRNNFSGSFPSGISSLHNLDLLDAFSNSFSGLLPEDAARLEHLRVLNFAGSYFSGPIPSEYGSFKNLEFIHLAGNFLTGSIPPELGKLKKLSHMEIGYNSYEGGIPWQFGNMSSLQYLDIAVANISGQIPFQFSNLTSLESLFLFRNQLDGMIPRDLSKMLALKSLDLSDNLLSGTVPESFSVLKNLSLLSLMFNDLSGPVPHGIAMLPNLDTLLIWNNYFTGPLHEDLGRFSKLKHIDVSTNFLTGSIPEGICVGGELQKLILFSNNFTGGLSPALSNCSSLIRIRVEDNMFSGEISLRFNNLPHVSYVDLSKNKFTGGVPSDITRASALEYFNASYNQELGGVLPVETWSLSNLQNFSVVSCGLSGSVPPFEHCESVTVVELRMNNLVGEIPQSVSNCIHLIRIDIAENNLTGPIPVELADLPVISILDLSHNSLSSAIPPPFRDSLSLELLNVSYNDISGSIPSNENFRGMDQSAFLGNPRLCGIPLRPCHHENRISDGLESGSRKAQKSAWILIFCAASVLFSMAAVLGILCFKRQRKGRWEMIAFEGLPEFRAKDVLRSFNSAETITIQDSIAKVILPTGIIVSARKIEWEPYEMEEKLRILINIGNARHKNLTRLLGICYNKSLAYLLYDYLPYGSLAEKISTKNDWETKCRVVTGIARGLSFLHHDCYPTITHGNLTTKNVLFDENMEPHLADYGLNSISAKIARETGRFKTTTKEELYMDVYRFGTLILEILTNGRRPNTAEITQKEVFISEIAEENRIPSKEEVKLIIEVALLCLRSRPFDRPSMQDTLKFLLGLKSNACKA